jgi:hypothetical protein
MKGGKGLFVCGGRVGGNLCKKMLSRFVSH